VKPRHEKKALERLTDQFAEAEQDHIEGDSDDNIELFCPMKEERVKWSDRWKTVTKPYIPGYLFARVREQQRIEILNDPSVFRTVCRKGRPAKIRDEEIAIVKRVIGDPGVDDLRLEALQPGDRVEVTGGELMNMNGVVVMVKGNRATILLESMHCNMTFTVDRSQLEVMG
jgi:transcription antitermination factor NusG